MKKRLLSIALALGMLISCSASVFAEETQANALDSELLKDYSVADVFGTGEPIVSNVEVESDKIVHVTTNALDCWGNADSFTFLHKKETVDTKKYPTTVISTTVCDVKGSASPNAASGPMMRTDLKADSPHVVLRVRPSGQIILSWRLAKGDICRYTVGPTIKAPVKLKLERSGDLYVAYYKIISAEEDNQWIEFGSINAFLGDDIYAGFCTFTIDQSTPVTASLRRLNIKNYAAGQPVVETDAETAGEKQDDAEVWEGVQEKIKIQKEKEEALKAFYLIEKFEDMNLTSGGETVENTKWLTSEASPAFEKDEDGTVWWVRNKVPTLAYVGKPTWADYKMSFDFVMDPATAENTFVIYVRTKPDVIPESAIAPCYYSLHMNNKQIYMMKAIPFRTKNTYNKLSTTFADFADGKKHTMVIEAFDNSIKLSVDGKVLFNFTDGSSFPHTRGLVGFDTRNINIKMSNLIVEKMEDELGGVYDNYIGYSFDQPILDIIKKSIVIGE